MVDPLALLFPGLLRGGYRVTSPRNGNYNCVAWAARDSGNWWWPLPLDDRIAFWPSGIAREESLAAFHTALASIGYAECVEEAEEPGFEKIALFANRLGVPLHAARQLPGGRWTSKLGELEDIEHELRDLEGAEYGEVVSILRRPLSPTHLPLVKRVIVERLK